MAAVESLKPQPVVPALKAGQVFVAGRIKARTKIGKTFIHLVLAPAADQYSFPQPFEVSSKAPLGDVDEDVKVVCNCNCRQAKKNYTDKETGEQKAFRGAYMDLRAVEE